MRAANDEAGRTPAIPKGRVAQDVETRARQDGMFYASSLQGKTPKPRKWIVPDLIPDSAVTLFSGNGAIGKSILSMQLVTAAAAGQKWLDADVERCRALYLSAEDDRDEMHRRLERVNTHYGLEPADYESELILWDKTMNAQPFLFRDQEGWQESPFYCLLNQAVIDLGVRLVVIDSMYNFFGGNELSRTDSTAFMDCLQRLALEAECAIVVLWHPSASGLDSGTGTSGSTAFRNRARQMLYMQMPKETEGEVDPDVRLLKIVKSNYGPNNVEYRLRFGNGVLLPDGEHGGGFLDEAGKARQRQVVKDIFMVCLDAANEQGRYPTDGKNSPRYAPKMFKAMPAGEGISFQKLARAMEDLFAEGTIVVRTVKGEDRHAQKAIVRSENALIPGD